MIVSHTVKPNCIRSLVICFGLSMKFSEVTLVRNRMRPARGRSLRPSLLVGDSANVVGEIMLQKL